MPTILIVDDDARCREPLARMLRRDGYNVIRVANGREALEALDTENIDLILLDVLMPEMDGFDFLAKLRGRVEGSLPVIMVSGVFDNSTIARALGLGVSDFLIKSRFSVPQLLEHIRSRLGEQRAPDEPQQLSVA